MGLLLATWTCTATALAGGVNFSFNFDETDGTFGHQHRQAIEYAGELWSDWLQGSPTGEQITLSIDVRWDPDHTSAYASSTRWYNNDLDVIRTGAQMAYRTGTSQNAGLIGFAPSPVVNWYTHTSGYPSGSDMVTVTLHEIGHLMGQSTGYQGPDSEWGRNTSQASGRKLTDFDRFLLNADGVAPQAGDNAYSLDGVGFAGPNALARFGGNPIPVVDPNDPIQDSRGNPANLAHPYRTRGFTSYGGMSASQHGLFAHEQGMFEDLGWSFVSPGYTTLSPTGHPHTHARSHVWDNGVNWDSGLAPTAQTNVDFHDSDMGWELSLNLFEYGEGHDVRMGGSTWGRMFLDVQGGWLDIAGQLRIGSINDDANAELTVMDDPDRAERRGMVSVAREILIGDEGRGVLNIHAGSMVRGEDYASLGQTAGGRGILNVMDAGSLFSIDNMLNVGWDGSGTVNVADGGRLETGGGRIGSWAGSSGQVHLAGANSRWDLGSSLDVGGNVSTSERGESELRVLEGGQVHVAGAMRLWADSHTEFGDGTTLSAHSLTLDEGAVMQMGTNTVRLSDQGSKANLGVWVGLGSGTGEIHVGDGSQLQTTAAHLGVDTAAAGHAQVQDHSTWDVDGRLNLGVQGRGDLSITHGGKVNSGRGTLGDGAHSRGIVTIAGEHSQWNMAGELFIAVDGRGEMSIANRALVQNESSIIAGNAGSQGTLTVEDTGTEWRVRQYLRPGWGGTGTLNIRDGALVSSAAADIGYGADAVGTVQVEGRGTRWINHGQGLSGQISIAEHGQGVLHVLDGAQVMTDDPRLIMSTGLGSASQLVVSGVNQGERGERTPVRSRLISTGSVPDDAFLDMGFMGIDGTAELWVLDGAEVDLDTSLFMAFNSTSQARINIGTPDTATSASPQLQSEPLLDIPNPYDSELTLGGDLNVAHRTGNIAGGSALVNVAPRGHITVHGRTDLGGDGHSGPAALNLFGGTFTTESLHVHQTGHLVHTDGVLTIDGGSFVHAPLPTALTIDGQEASDLPSLRLLDSASTQNITQLSIGDTRQGAMEVRSGASITSGDESLIGRADGATGQVLITGSRSQWTVASFDDEGELERHEALDIGHEGSGTLRLADGGLLNTRAARIGVESGASGSVTVTGMDHHDNPSTWISHGGISINRYGGYGELNIEDGGRVVSHNDHIGASTSSQGDQAAHATITGTRNGIASTWINDHLLVGHRGAGNMTVSHGGYVHTREAHIGRLMNSSDGFARITGTDNQGITSTWRIDELLTIGNTHFSSGQGGMNIEAGGQVISHEAHIGTGEYGIGTVNVAGTDHHANSSRWTTQSLELGTAFQGMGTLHIHQGGHVHVHDDLTVNNRGTVRLAGGGQLDVGSYFSRGTFHFDGGAFTVRGGSFEHTPFPTHLHLDGQTPGDKPTLRLVEQAFTRNINQLEVGQHHRAALEIESGSRLSSNESWIGRQSTSQGEVRVAGASANGTSSTWNLNGDRLWVGGAGQGTLIIEEGGHVYSGVSMIAGWDPLGQGKAIVTGADASGSSSLWQTNSLYIGGDQTQARGAGSLHIAQDARVIVNDEFRLWSTGTLTGGGQLDVSHMISEGIISPGNSTDVLTIDGDFTQVGEQSAVHIQLAGNTLGHTYDQLRILGDANFFGTLLVELDEFIPSFNDSFNILSFDNTAHWVGQELIGGPLPFATIELPQLANTLHCQTDALYTHGVISVIPEPGTLSIIATAGLILLCRRAYPAAA